MDIANLKDSGQKTAARSWMALTFIIILICHAKILIKYFLTNVSNIMQYIFYTFWIIFALILYLTREIIILKIPTHSRVSRTEKNRVKYFKFETMQVCITRERKFILLCFPGWESKPLPLRLQRALALDSLY